MCIELACHRTLPSLVPGRLLRVEHAAFSVRSRLSTLDLTRPRPHGTAARYHNVVVAPQAHAPHVERLYATRPQDQDARETEPAQSEISLSRSCAVHSAEVDLSGEWTMEGMSYVALSRVTSPDRLIVRDFDVSQVKVSPLVKTFYDQLYAKVVPPNRGLPMWDDGVEAADKLCANSYCDVSRPEKRSGGLMMSGEREN